MSNFKNVHTLLQFSKEKMTKNGIFDTDRFHCDVYGFEPGQEQSAHTHGEQDKVYYVLEGKGTFKIGDEEKVLGAGEIALAPAGQAHGVKNNTQEKLVTLVFVTPKAHHHH